MSRALLVRIVAIGVLLSFGFFAWHESKHPYVLKVLTPTADGTFKGGKVTIAGQAVGTVTDLSVEGKQALMTLSLDPDAGPLHAGTEARIDWESVVGGRVVELVPGPRANPALASGTTLISHTERVELDQVLAMLDAPTRAKVQGLIGRLNTTLTSNRQGLNETLRTAGPTIKALGSVMEAVGGDGPAIRGLVSRLHSMTSVLAAKHSNVGATIAHLHRLTAALANRRTALASTLAQLPGTIDAARSTLAKVPPAVDETVPLLNDLRPAADQLPETARNLSPVLKQLRPTVADLKPTLRSARTLFAYGPGFLDSAHDTFPNITTALTTLQPAVSFLRPYTPELTGWLTNWTSLFASQTNGNYARLLIPEGASSVVGVHASLPPGIQRDPTPAPGSIAGQPWTDANGDGVR